MGPAIITGVVSILAVLVSGAVAYFSRNERTLLDQELELLKKMKPDTDTAKKLGEVVNARVTRWHRKALKKMGAGKEQQVRRFWSASDTAFVVAGVAALVTLFLALDGAYDRH